SSVLACGGCGPVGWAGCVAWPGWGAVPGCCVAAPGCCCRWVDGWPCAGDVCFGDGAGCCVLPDCVCAAAIAVAHASVRMSAMLFINDLLSRATRSSYLSCLAEAG